MMSIPSREAISTLLGASQEKSEKPAKARRSAGAVLNDVLWIGGAFMMA
jgi:hypothetical protein